MRSQGGDLVIAIVRGNPFETLGITPGALEGLSDEEVLLLAGDVFKSLSKIHDPARGGLKRKHQAIFEAWAAINDHETFLKVKEAHLRTRDEKLEALERELRKARVMLGDCDCKR